MTRARQPSAERVAQYVREEMIDGATVEAVIAGNQRGNASVATVRWRVWVRLLDEGYSGAGIARSFQCDHSSVLWARRKMARGLLPFNGKAVRPPKAKVERPVKRPPLIKWVGYDPSARGP